MNNFTKNNINQLRSEINVALQQLGTKYGIDIHAGNASYTPSNITFKLKVSQVVNGVVETQEMKDWNSTGRYMTKLDLNTVVRCQGERFQIVGWSRRSRKYPVLAKSLRDNQTYKLTVDYIKSGTVIG